MRHRHLDGPTETKPCEMCGKLFRALKRELRIGKGRFCGLNCKYDFDSINTTQRYEAKRGLNYHLKFQAYEQLRCALIAQLIVKPVSCEICGNDKKRLEAHHTDYANALDVKWLCNSCHTKQHI